MVGDEISHKMRQKNNVFSPSSIPLAILGGKMFLFSFLERINENGDAMFFTYDKINYLALGEG